MSKSTMTSEQYQELRAGYADSLGYDINSLTSDQEHSLEEKMAADGVLQPRQLTLGGTIEPAQIPNAGKSQALTVEPKAKATRKKREAAPAPASIQNRDVDIERMLTNLAHQGEDLGNLGAQIFTHTFSGALNVGITETVNDALQNSRFSGMSVSDFLDR